MNINGSSVEEVVSSNHEHTTNQITDLDAAIREIVCSVLASTDDLEEIIKDAISDSHSVENITDIDQYYSKSDHKHKADDIENLTDTINSAVAEAVSSSSTNECSMDCITGLEDELTTIKARFDSLELAGTSNDNHNDDQDEN